MARNATSFGADHVIGAVRIFTAFGFGVNDGIVGNAHAESVHAVGIDAAVTLPDAFQGRIDRIVHGVVDRIVNGDVDRIVNGVVDRIVNGVVDWIVDWIVYGVRIVAIVAIVATAIAGTTSTVVASVVIGIVAVPFASPVIPPAV